MSRARSAAHAEVLRLARMGLGPAAIADKLGCTSVYARNLMRRARRFGEPIPLHRTTLSNFLTARISAKSAEALCVEAMKRGCTATALAIDVLEAVASDGLFNAVLDDGEA